MSEPHPNVESQPRAPYGRSDANGPASDGRPQEPYEGETYYQKPALKPGHYRWLIATYFWVGGLAGAAAMLSVVADFAGSPEDRVVVRFGRYFALAGSLLGAVLLIADLHTPRRFLNMLRIFRRTSPMSFGAWVLALFGLFGGLAAATQVAEDFGGWEGAITLGRVIGIPLAITGLIMAYYTGTLLATTSVPLWAAIPRQLAALFAVSSASLAAAALSMTGKLAGASNAVTERLEAFDLIVILMEIGVLIATDLAWQRRGVVGPLRKWPMAPFYFGGVMILGIAVPLVIYSYLLLTGTSSTAASLTAAAAALAGGFLLRFVILFGGRESAESPQDYFHFTQPSPAPAGAAQPEAAR